MRHPHLNIIIALLTAILIVLLWQGCMTTNGLHPENSRRNAGVKWQQYNEHKSGVVR